MGTDRPRPENLEENRLSIRSYAKRRRFGVALVALLGVSAVTACGSDDDEGASTTAASPTTAAASPTTAGASTSTSAEATPTTIGAPIKVRVVGATSLNSVVHFTTLTFDEFAKHGVDYVAAPDVASSALMVQTVLTGDADIGLIGSSGMLGALAEGQDIVALADYSHVLAQVFNVSKDTESNLAKSGVTSKSPIADRVKALKGLTIGTTAVGTTTDVIIRSLLTEYGLNPNADVTIRNLPDPPAVTAAARANQLDAFMTTAPPADFPVLINFAAGEVPIFKEFSYSTFVTTRKFLESNPEAVRRFMSAEWAGWQRLQTDPKATLAAVKQKYFPNLDQPSFDFTTANALLGLGDGFYASPKAFETLMKVYNSTLAPEKQIKLSFDDVYDTTIATATKPK